MCQASVYFNNRDKEEILFNDAIQIKAEKNKVLIQGLNNEKEIYGIIKEVDFIHHKVIIEKEEE